MNYDDLHNVVSQDVPTVNAYCAAVGEAERLTKQYGKNCFNCEDLMKILGVGRNNVRELMRSKDFPTRIIGGRKVVPAIALAIWMMSDYWSES